MVHKSMAIPQWSSSGAPIPPTSQWPPKTVCCTSSTSEVRSYRKSCCRTRVKCWSSTGTSKTSTSPSSKKTVTLCICGRLWLQILSKWSKLITRRPRPVGWSGLIHIQSWLSVLIRAVWSSTIKETRRKCRQWASTRRESYQVTGTMRAS